MSCTLLLSSFLALASAAAVAPRQSQTPTPPALLPVPLGTVSGGVGSDPSLRTSESWYWGLDSTAAHANLTATYAGKYQKVISMERVSSLVQSYQCASSHDAITVTFKTPSAYQSAKSSWDWVNQMAFRSFILTVDQAGCQTGNNDQGGGKGRQPYQVNGITWDDDHRVATLKATAKTWQDAVASQDASSGITYEFQADSKGITGDAGSNNNRKDKRITINNSASISLAHDFSQPIFKETVKGVDVELDCSKCDTKGSLDFKVHIIPFLVPPKLEGFGQVTPSGVGAEAVVSLTVSGELDSVQKDLNLATVSLPGGFQIPGVATFGPQLRIGITAQLSDISASATASFGVQMSVPDSSIAKVDFTNSNNNQLSGWVPTFTPVPPELSAELRVTASIGPQLTVTLEATLFGQGVAAGVALLAPKLEATLTASADSAGGQCGIDDATVGVGLDLGIGAEVDAFAGAGRPQDLPNKVDIFTTSVGLFSTCFPLATAAVKADSAPAPAKRNFHVGVVVP